MAILTGNAMTEGGDPVDSVIIRDWDTHVHIEAQTPDGNGDWSSSDLAAGDYDITYVASNYQPICHGPYTVEAS